MANEEIQKLFDSFTELEYSLQLARRSLEMQSPQPTEVLQRLESYEQVVTKQRLLAERLCDHITVGDWHEVSRHIKLINGLTALIYGDARELTAGIDIGSSGTPTEFRDS